MLVDTAMPNTQTDYDAIRNQGTAERATAVNATGASDEIPALDAQRLPAAIRARRLSCREVMQAYLSRMHR